MPKRPLLVTIVSLVLIVSAAAGLAFHLADFRTAPARELVPITLVRALAIVAGAFMLRGSNWARWLAMLWIAFHVVLSIFHSVSQLVVHIVVFCVFAFALFRAGARAYFRRAEA